MKSFLTRLFDAATSLKLTLVCMAAAMVLVFIGTLAYAGLLTPAKMSLHDVQAFYFQSWFLWWQPSGPEGVRIPVFPGGHLLGAAMLVNLILVQARAFPKQIRKGLSTSRIFLLTGLYMTHLGILIILAGGLFTDLFATESRMVIREGETTNYSEDSLRMELAVIDETDPKLEQVVAIPDGRLVPGATIGHPELPFKIRVLRWFANSKIAPIKKGETPAATQGIGARLSVAERPRVTAPDKRDVPAAIVEVLIGGEPAGTWLVSPMLGKPQGFEAFGRQWTLSLRPVRYYKPYSVTLLDFTHERYPGTGIAKNFSSKIRRLVDPERSVDREVLIYMNHPLRYRGDTYYQASFGANDTVSVLQVVRNPSFLAPYVGCVVAGFGMLLLFGVHLWKFARRQASGSASSGTEPASPDDPPVAQAPKNANGTPASFGMKKIIPWLAFLVAVLWLAALWRPEPKSAEGFDTVAFGELPVLSGGRIKPFDTVARNSLLILNGKQTVRPKDAKPLEPARWLLDVFFDQEKADAYPVFLISNPDVLGLFGWRQGKKKRFSYQELRPFLEKIDEEGAKSAAVESPERTPYQTAVINLRNSLQLYQQLRTGMRPPDAANFAAELSDYAASLESGLRAVQARARNQPYDPEAFAAFATLVRRYDFMASYNHLRPVPPQSERRRRTGEWLSMGGSLLEAIQTGKVSPVTLDYARLGDAVRSGDSAAFDNAVASLTETMRSTEAEKIKRTAFERLFNHLQPFYASMGLYVLAVLLASFSWLAAGPELRRAAVWLLLLGLAVHTFGLGARMYLQGRPPVTNLYSSAVFIGWATVIIGLVLERIFKDGIGSAAAGAVGFLSLIIAHHLASSGDTLQMLQAVLDTNLWLATHVVTITIGYSAMFLAGLLAILYVVRGLFTRSLDKPLADALYRMVYGVVCFAAFFSFIGTVLGGIWADQSWGRFWGWDPKENGALLIVLWCAILLHARRAGFIRARGFMAGAIFGNAITAFSWFGVNMLNVGLHSYGFMDKAFPWLVGFVVSQFLLILLTAVPTRSWRSFRES